MWYYIIFYFTYVYQQKQHLIVFEQWSKINLISWFENWQIKQDFFFFLSFLWVTNSQWGEAYVSIKKERERKSREQEERIRKLENHCLQPLINGSRQWSATTVDITKRETARLDATPEGSIPHHL